MEQVVKVSDRLGKCPAEDGEAALRPVLSPDESIALVLGRPAGLGDDRDPVLPFEMLPK